MCISQWHYDGSASTRNDNFRRYANLRKWSNSWCGKRSNNVCRGEGEPELVTYTGEGMGRVSSTGNVKWRCSVFFRKSSGDKLAFLSSIVGSENG